MDAPLERMRRYTDQEVARILRRVVELQENEPRTAADTSGLSLTQLEEIAREAGLDPRYVRRAALDLDDSVSTHPTAAFLGSPSRLSIERRLDGELPEAEFEAVVDELRRAIGSAGQAGVLGRTLSWTSGPFGARAAARYVTATVTVRDGTTTLRIEESLTALAGGLFGGLMGGIGGGGGGVAMGVGIGVLGSPVAAVALVAAAIGGAYTLARAIFGRMARGRSRELRALADRLADRIAAASGPRPALSARVTSARATPSATDAGAV